MTGIDFTPAKIERSRSLIQLPVEIQEMIFHATNITDWDESTLRNMCLVHPFWASQIPHVILDRGENRDLIVSSLLFKAKNNLTNICKANHVFHIASKIKSLVLHGFDSFTDNQLLKIFDKFYNLESVTIGLSDKFTVGGVVTALKTAKRLKAFTLRCQMTNEGLADIAKHFPNIEGVDLTLCKGITDEGLVNFLSYCSDLKDFRFPKKISLETVCNGLQRSQSRLTSLDLSAIDKFDNGLFDKIHTKFPNLAFLVLPKDQSFTEEGVSALLGCPIQYIKVSGATNTDARLESVIKKAVHLQSLHLSNCPQLTDRTCEALAQYRPRLKRFTSSGQISNKGLSTLASSCSDLEHLDLLESKIVVDANLAKDLVEKLLHLKELWAHADYHESLPDIERLGRRLRQLRISNAITDRIQTICPNEIFL